MKHKKIDDIDTEILLFCYYPKTSKDIAVFQKRRRIRIPYIKGEEIDKINDIEKKIKEDKIVGFKSYYYVFSLYTRIGLKKENIVRRDKRTEMIYAINEIRKFIKENQSKKNLIQLNGYSNMKVKQLLKEKLLFRSKKKEEIVSPYFYKTNEIELLGYVLREFQMNFFFGKKGTNFLNQNVMNLKKNEILQDLFKISVEETIQNKELFSITFGMLCYNFYKVLEKTANFLFLNEDRLEILEEEIKKLSKNLDKPESLLKLFLFYMVHSPIFQNIDEEINKIINKNLISYTRN